MRSYVYRDGRPVGIDRELGRGGEGTVFSLKGDATTVVKIYHDPDAERSEKLTELITRVNSRLISVTAWPKEIVYESSSRSFAGFSMPRIEGMNPIQRLYNPRQRLQYFSRATWAFQIRTALNLTAAFDEVHKSGCLVGDVNERNIQVTSNALVRLVDCDSFQIRSGSKWFLCEVGVPQYVPPELQGRSLRGLVRSENHDRFGLATLIFQLLFVGRHPYQGLYQGQDEPSFEQLIKDFRFAHGPAAANWLMAPPPHVPKFSDIPESLGLLFRRAFERGSEKNARPTTGEWLKGIGELECSLAKCPNDSGHVFWRSANECTWCRIARNNGPEYYFGIGEAGQGFAIDNQRLQNVLKKIAQVEFIVAPYDRNQYRTSIPKTDTPLPPNLKELDAEVASLFGRIQQAESEIVPQNRKDLELANAQLRLHEERLGRAYRLRNGEASKALEDALFAVESERQNLKTVYKSISFKAFLPLLIFLIGATYHWVFQVFLLVVLALGCFAIFLHFFFFYRTDSERRLLSAKQKQSLLKKRFDLQRKETMRQIKQELLRRRDSRTAHLALLKATLQDLRQRLVEACEIEVRRVNKLINDAGLRLKNLESKWEDIVQLHDKGKSELVAKVNALAKEIKDLEGKFEDEKKQLSANAESLARMRHLQLFSIADSGVSGIGYGRLQLLAINGIHTAYDVEAHRIRQVSGFGDVLTDRLLMWKNEILKQFRFTSSSGALSKEVVNQIAKYKIRESTTFNEIDSTFRILESLSNECRKKTSLLVPEIRQALIDYEQARIREVSLKNRLSSGIGSCR
jgi:DNA-binding helix-hairpin-helix protein with protein kinase domain